MGIVCQCLLNICVENIRMKQKVDVIYKILGFSNPIVVFFSFLSLSCLSLHFLFFFF